MSRYFLIFISFFFLVVSNAQGKDVSTEKKIVLQELKIKSNSCRKYTEPEHTSRKREMVPDYSNRKNIK